VSFGQATGRAHPARISRVAGKMNMPPKAERVDRERLRVPWRVAAARPDCAGKTIGPANPGLRSGRTVALGVGDVSQGLPRDADSFHVLLRFGRRRVMRIAAAGK